MFNHLLGRGHREKFFGNKYETDYEKVNSHKILQMAEKERENKNIESITTIYSDELYPWLSGKAPWSLEQGKFFQILFILKFIYFQKATKFCEIFPLLLTGTT